MIPIFLIILFGNVWIWKILKFNIFAGLLLITATSLILLFLNKKRSYLIIIAFISLIITVQFTGGFKKIDLSYGSQENLLMEQRVNEYPPISILPIAHWLEERPEMIAIYRINQNFSEVVDPNLYFFANHPKERTGINETEKIPYILLPIFIYGIFIMISRKYYKIFALFFGFPLTYYSLYGTGEGIQPILFFPFFMISIYLGFENFLVKLKIIPKIIFWLIYFLILLQQIIYAIY